MAYSVPTLGAGQVLTSAMYNVFRDNDIYFYAYGSERARAEVTNNATQSIANAGSGTAVAFNTENVDAFAMHSASGTRLTVPSGWGGWWLFTAWITFASNATGLRQVALVANGSLAVAGQMTTAVSGADHNLAVSSLVRLSAADYVEVVAFQTSGGALNLTSGPLFRAAWMSNAG